jgi:hypothetical protein
MEFEVGDVVCALEAGRQAMVIRVVEGEILIRIIKPQNSSEKGWPDRWYVPEELARVH